MQPMRSGANLPPVDDDDRAERGRAIQARLDALGIKDREFHRRTGIDRKTLNRAIDALPTVRPSTYDAIESALDRIESDMKPRLRAAEDERTAEAGLVTFKLSGNFGVDVVVQGPVDNLDELEESVERLIRRMRDKGDSA
jgi:hypothetical protein